VLQSLRALSSPIGAASSPYRRVQISATGSPSKDEPASEADKFRLTQAEALLREAGFVPQIIDGAPSGYWVRPTA